MDETTIDNLMLPWTIDVDFAYDQREELGHQLLDYLHKAGLRGIFATCTCFASDGGGWPIMRLRAKLTSFKRGIV